MKYTVMHMTVIIMTLYRGYVKQHMHTSKVGKLYIMLNWMEFEPGVRVILRKFCRVIWLSLCVCVRVCVRVRVRVCVCVRVRVSTELDRHVCALVPAWDLPGHHAQARRSSVGRTRV